MPRSLDGVTAPRLERTLRTKTREESEAEHRESRLRRLVQRLAEEDPSASLAKGTRWLMTVLPVLGWAVILLLTALLAGWRAGTFLAVCWVFSFVGAGKFIIFGGAVIGPAYQAADLSAWLLAGMVVYSDIGTCLVLMANMRLLYRTPWVGRRLAMAHDAGWYVLHVHRWMHRVAWLGVAVFVAAPFQATGAVIGTLLGRILGLSRFETLSATAFGSAVGCSVLALLGDVGRRHARAFVRHPVLGIGIFVGTLVVLLLLGRWFLGHSAEAREQYLAEHEAADVDARRGTA